MPITSIHERSLREERGWMRMRMGWLVRCENETEGVDWRTGQKNFLFKKSAWLYKTCTTSFRPCLRPSRSFSPLSSFIHSSLIRLSLPSGEKQRFKHTLGTIQFTSPAAARLQESDRSSPSISSRSWNSPGRRTVAPELRPWNTN
jgi:hypothetical protein